MKTRGPDSAEQLKTCNAGLDAEIVDQVDKTYKFLAGIYFERRYEDVSQTPKGEKGQ